MGMSSSGFAGAEENRCKPLWEYKKTPLSCSEAFNAV